MWQWSRQGRRVSPSAATTASPVPPEGWLAAAADGHCVPGPVHPVWLIYKIVEYIYIETCVYIMAWEIFIASVANDLYCTFYLLCCRAQRLSVTSHLSLVSWRKDRGLQGVIGKMREESLKVTETYRAGNSSKSGS